MGQESAVSTFAHWMDVRASHRAGAGRAECLAIADLLRTGEWLEELKELEKCR
jgi:hypothetical protein